MGHGVKDVNNFCPCKDKEALKWTPPNNDVKSGCGCASLGPFESPTFWDCSHYLSHAPQWKFDPSLISAPFCPCLFWLCLADFSRSKQCDMHCAVSCDSDGLKLQVAWDECTWFQHLTWSCHCPVAQALAGVCWNFLQILLLKSVSVRFKGLQTKNGDFQTCCQNWIPT